MLRHNKLQNAYFPHNQLLHIKEVKINFANFFIGTIQIIPHEILLLFIYILRLSVFKLKVESL